uniref:Uncharacterized protein n=1 Tax=Arundo donax TaxID=35708 RepID=A0A0A9FTC9_ARUDO
MLRRAILGSKIALHVRNVKSSDTVCMCQRQTNES